MERTAIPELRAFLLGRWRVERRILAAGGAAIGRFRGEATFAPDLEVPGLLRYVEEGTLVLGAHRGPAFRRLGYHVDGATARVAFDDGRRFHDLDLRDGVDEVVHPCGADRYRGRFEVLDHHRWRQIWTVTGPHKDDTILTDFTRVTSGPTGRAPGQRADGSRTAMPGYEPRHVEVFRR